jgi:hypothetical protein
MNDEFKTETEILSDWNFIVTNGGQTIYDLTSGIKYRYHLSMLANTDHPSVSAERIGYEPVFEFYEGDEAKEFWARLSERVDLNNL